MNYRMPLQTYLLESFITGKVINTINGGNFNMSLATLYCSNVRFASIKAETAQSFTLMITVYHAKHIFVFFPIYFPKCLLLGLLLLLVYTQHV